MSDILFSMRNLAVRYGAARVVDDIDLDVREAEVVGLVGLNGTGKTSTLRAISGVVPRSAGILTFMGAALPQRPDAVARLGIAHVPEGRALFARLTARQNIEVGAAAVGKSLGHDELDSYIRLFPQIEAFLWRPAGQLSGGQQQMIAVCRGLASKPRLLMVDELSLGLAPAVVTDLLRGLRQVAQARRIGLLLVDQNIRALASVCDRATIIRDGKGFSTDLHASEIIRGDYLGPSAMCKTREIQ